MRFMHGTTAAAALAALLWSALPATAQNATYPPSLDCTQFNGAHAANCRSMIELQQNNPANRRPTTSNTPATNGANGDSANPGSSGSNTIPAPIPGNGGTGGNGN